MKATAAFATVATASSVHQGEPNLPLLEDKCCTPLDEIPVQKPTQKWICDKLRGDYDKLWGECNTFTTTFMDSLNIENFDTTFHDSYTKEYKIEQKQTHIQKWFSYYCPAIETEPEEDFAQDTMLLSGELSPDETGAPLALAQTSLPQVRGNGPNGKFGGNFDHWTEKEDLYNQLFYEITQTWFYCQHRSLKAYYTMERVENDVAKDSILAKYNDMKAEWKTLIQNEMDPRRIWLGKFTRYNIHQKEYHEWALRPVLNYEKIYERAQELGQSPDNNIFCEDYDEKNAEYLERLHNIRGKFQSGLDQIIELGEAEDFGGRVNAFTKKDLTAAKQFPLDVYFDFWKPQIQCYIENNGKNQEIQDFWKVVRFYTIEDNSKFSMNCNYRRILNRVRYWQYITLAESENTKTQCRTSLQTALADRSKILSNEDPTNVKNNWTTPAEGALADDLVEENTAKINEIVQFLTDWENLDERLYDTKGGRFKLINEFTAVTKSAMEVYYWYHRMGDAAMAHHAQDKSWQTRAWWNGRKVTNNARKEFRQTCWRPLSQMLFLVTPRY